MLFNHIFLLYMHTLMTLSWILYFVLSIDDQISALATVEHSISDIRSWMLHDKFKLNNENLNFYSLVHINNWLKFLLTRLGFGLWMFPRLVKPETLVCGLIQILLL